MLSTKTTANCKQQRNQMNSFFNVYPAADTPDYGQKGATSSYKDRGSYGRDGPTAPDEDLPPSTAPVNGGSGYRSFGDVHHIGNTADNDIYRVTPNVNVYK